jgi:type IX secretion system PorP/SprF family membrane protein
MKIINMKKISILIIAICFGGMLKAQQLPQITQYMINNYAVNPAVAGMYDYYQVKTTIRNQWVGITDAPRTTVLSIYGRKNRNVGLGGLVFNDQAGPTSRIGGSASYTYSFAMTRAVKMSFALSGGFTQFKITKQGLNIEDKDDPFMQGGDVVRSAPDATFGFNIYGDKWYFGAAIPQLLSANLNLIDDDFVRIYNTNLNTLDDVESKGKLAQHMYVLGAYKHNFNPFWSIEPSVLLKTVGAAPLQFDFGLKTTYNDKLWFGMDYRNNGEIAALLGYSIQERFMIGYSYDVLNSNMSGYAGGSHEFMIGIRFVAADESDIMK